MKLKHIRRLATRGVLVPFALFALVLASSLPVSAQSSDPAASYDSSASYIDIGPLSMNW